MRKNAATVALLSLTAACAGMAYDQVMITPLDSVVGESGMRPGAVVVTQTRFLGAASWDTARVVGRPRGRFKLELDTVALKISSARRLGDTLEAVVTELPDGLVGRPGVRFLSVSADAAVVRLPVDEITRVRVHSDELKFDWLEFLEFLGEFLGVVAEVAEEIAGDAVANRF